MSIETWISFVAASMALCLSPGPTVFLVIGQSLAYGKKSVIPTVLGTMTGDIVALTCSLLGVGAVLVSSLFAFSMMKWLGVAYLVYLGIKAWCSPVSDHSLSCCQRINRWEMYKNSLLVTALNPKGLIFFMAFFPLFISPHAEDVLLQMLILAMTFIAVSLFSVTFYTYFAGRIRNYVSSVKAQVIFNKTSGGILIGAAILTSTLKK
ncbi:LysE family translocator [Vibrio ruber]|uniref:LysE family translocator n=1 Tax=Vibrio ruber TaxID=184755 RepID=UPI002893244B|nr:LysE family translocator [Vibrio ruber]WNJ97558.1 LysE family translocator [Vibrio ruber]